MSTKPDLNLEPGSLPAWTASPAGTAWGCLEGAETVIGDERYLDGGELGRGGMGVVRVATDQWLEREVAIKRALPQLPESVRARLVREAKITARLSHPGILPIFDVGADERGAFYTMPVLRGRSMRAAIDDPDCQASALVRALSTVCRALSFAHDAGVVHRDVKPSNISLGEHGEVRLLDWGVAFDPEDPDEHAVGTPGYQSPEQARGERVGPSADVYSVGVVLEQLLTGRGEGTEALGAVARRCTAPAPEARYAHGAEVADELDRWLDGRRVRAHSYTPLELIRRLVRAWRAPLAVAGFAAVALLLLLVGWGISVGIQRDRALAAEARSETLRMEANQSLARSLAQQGAARLLEADQATSEALAAESLRLVESPEARGVLMAWHGTPRPRQVKAWPFPCERPFPSEEGRTLLCVEPAAQVGDPHRAEISLWTLEGERLWAATADTPEVEGVAFVAGYRGARVVGDLVMLRREPGLLELWREGQRLGVGEVGGVVLSWASGPTPAVHDGRRVGVVHADGTVEWSGLSCERIQVAYVNAPRVVVGCANAEIYAGTMDDLGEARPVRQAPSAVGWHDGVIVGTFDGYLLAERGEGWLELPSGVGAPYELTELGFGVSVLGERPGMRVWNPTTGAFLVSPPGEPFAVRRQGDTLTVFTSEEIQTHRYTEVPVPVVFDRRDHGGLVFVTPSPDGSLWLAGSANGEVITWRTRDGEARVIAGPTGNVAKGGAFVGEEVVYAQLGGGVHRSDLRTGERALVSVGPHKGLKGLADGHIVMAPYRPYLRTLELATGVVVEAPMQSVPYSFAVDGDTTWAVDSAGVWEIHGEESALRMPNTDITRVAAHQGLLYVSEGSEVVARDPSGRELWRAELGAHVTSLTADARFVVAGDRGGHVHVLSPQGRLLATAQGHTRLVSDVQIMADTLVSASWDGTARRWGLGAVAQPRMTLVEQVSAGWGEVSR